MENEYQSPLDEERERAYGIGSFLWEVIKVFLLALVIITPIRVFLFQPFFVEGASMEPNFYDGDYLIINELGYKTTVLGVGENPWFTVQPFKELQRGDVVVFRYPKDPGKYFIKRVVGLPGEKVKVAESKVMVFNAQHPDGIALEEELYLKPGTVTTKDVNLALEEGKYFVMGDNRGSSFDSRDWGPLPKEDIMGKVMLRAWPFSDAQVY